MNFKRAVRFLTIWMVIFGILGGWFAAPASAANAGTALQFDGTDDFVTFGAAAGESLLGVKIFTIETWFKKTGSGATTSTGTGGLTAAIPLITKGRGQAENSTQDMNYFFGIDSTGVLAADFEECARAQTGCPQTTTNATQGGQNFPAKGLTVISENVWYHAAVTFDGRYWKFYLNGVQDGTVDTGANRLPRWDSIQHAGIATAMTSTPTAAGFFQGMTDETRIWNVVRTQEEIQADMYSELTSGTGLIGRWGLNEGSGTTATNSISGRPNGTLTNGPTWVSGFPIPDTNPPAAPSGLVAAALTFHQVDLSWTDAADNENSFEIERCSGSGCSSFSLLATLPADSQTFSDANAPLATESCYRLRAVNSFGASDYSNTACAATPAEGASALEFNGSSQYVTFEGTTSLGVKAFTLETWFIRTGTGDPVSTGSGGVTAIPLVTKGRGEGDGSNVDMNYFFGIDATSGVLVADFEECSAAEQGAECPGGTAGLNHPVSGTTAIVNGTWYHAAVTYDGRYWKLYLNGSLDKTTDLGANILPRWDSVQHAGLSTAMTSTGATDGFFQGRLDEARIWNYARTQAEIQATINDELTSGSGLLGRWGLNDGAGATAYNSVAASPAGILKNAPAWVTPGSPFNITFPPPSAPAGLSATAVANFYIQLAWSDTSDNESAFELERCSGAACSDFSLLNSLPADTSAYADANVLPESAYCYRVRATNANGASEYSSAACATTQAEGAYALDFGYDNAYVTFGDPAKLDLATFTIETWFKRTGAGVSNTTGSGGISSAIPLVTHGSPQDDGSNVDANWVLVIDDSNDVIAADFEDTASGLNHPVYGVTPIQENTWYHAAATYDGATWRLYLNGNLEATLAVNQTPRADTIQRAGLAAMIESDGTVNGHFQGALDEARVWNYARSQEQIREEINNQVALASGLVARWGFGEGSGTLLSDSVLAPAAANGTVTNTGYNWITPGAPFDITFETVPPAAPTNLMASKRPGAVQLEWTANTEPDLSGYNVYRSTASPVVAGTPVNSTKLISPSYLDSDVSAGTPYFYAVTAVDTSGNESALSNEASAIPDPPPPPEALDFGSGTAYVTFGDPAALDLATFTIETWFKRTGAGTVSTTGSSGITNALPLVTHGAPEADGSNVDANWVLVIDDSSDVIAADFEDSASGLNHPVVGTTPIVNNTWYHAAATYDGTTWRLYLNGNLEATLAVNAAPRADTIQRAGLATMIESDGTTNGHFQGALDEARIWNYARTQAQIVSTINAKLTTPETGMVGRWGLDEGSGTVVNDASGNAITGTVTGTGYTWVPGSPFNAVVNLSPDVPVLVEPADSATGIAVPATLSVNVSDPESHSLDVTFYGRPIQAAAGPDFTVIAIPDTQYYAATYPSIFNAQMNWVADNRVSDNIVFVGSLGDNVDVASNLTQWANAVTAWDIIDGTNIPYGLAAGNHDGAPSGTANFNANFGISRFSGKPFYGGHQGSDNDNSYALFEASGLKFIVLFLEYDDSMTSSSHAVLQWANTILQANSDRRAIVISHNMLQGGTSTEFTTQGGAIYNALKGNPNLFLMLGGHLDVASRKTSIYNGNTVYTLRSDYQSVDSQQSGYLRIMRFSPANNMIYVRTYSPTQLKDYDKSDADQNNFSLTYPMDSASFEVIGTANGVASGGTASIAWPGLDAGAEYEWFVVVSDGTHQTSSATWSFTTGGGSSNTPPAISESDPQAVAMAKNGSPIAFDLTLNAVDPDVTDTLTWSISTPALHGTASIPTPATGASHAIAYTPDPDYVGADSFGVSVSDGSLSDTITVNVTVLPTTSLTLQAGWNLISFNLHPYSTDIAEVLSPLDGGFDLVYAWDASGATSGGWLKYDTIAGSPDSLAALDETMGFWIHMTAPGALEIAGNPPSTTNISQQTGAGGWNLVSFRVHPESTSTASVLADISGKFNLVYAWDATGGHPGSGNWLKYDPGQPVGNSLTNLDETMGFWIYMTQVDTLDVSGTKPATTNISLSTAAGGWNLSGYPSDDAGTMPAALNDHGVGTDWSIVWAYHAAEADQWKKYDPTAPVGNDLAALTSGWGYWIEVTANHTWHVEY
jgi:hypothetical protein